MGRIVILDENTANKIAAGEVVERPASVVKELVENSIDAGATAVTIEIKNGGIAYLRITDNGSGMEEDDVEIAFERHATSKIRSASDLESIHTLGFRGEALASIAAVSRLELVTRTPASHEGTSILIQGGRTIEKRNAGCPVGTTIVVRDLFFNTPARYKFLKKDSTEAGYIHDAVSKMVLGNPSVSFKLISNNSLVLHSPGNGDLLSAIFSVYGKDVARSVIGVKYSDSGIAIDGFVGKPEIARSNRNHQVFFLNGRLIRSKLLSSAVDEACKTLLMSNKFAFALLNFKIDPVMVDVNVHPSKMEVRFSDEQSVFRAVYHAVNNGLLNKNLIPEVVAPVKNLKPLKTENEYEQTGILNIYAGNKNNFPPMEKNKEYDINQKFQKKKERGEVLPETDANRKDVSFLVREGERSELQEAHKIEKHDVQTEGHVSMQLEQENQTGTEWETRTPQDTRLNKEDSNTTQEKDKQESAFYSDHSEAQPVKLSACPVIGQAFNTFILLQGASEIYLVDQHAAHERILFERLMVNLSGREKLVQMLLAPVVVELTPGEYKITEEHLEFLRDAGFDLDTFGANSFVIRGIPVLLRDEDAKELFLEVIDTLVHANRREILSLREETIYTMACKMAVKANRELSSLEIEGLLQQLDEIRNPFTCPHGRPVAIKISRYELEKKFKRVV